mgnify:CR=1 FL=1
MRKARQMNLQDRHMVAQMMNGLKKMQKHALDSLKIYLKWRMKLVSSTSEKQTLHM